MLKSFKFKTIAETMRLFYDIKLRLTEPNHVVWEYREGAALPSRLILETHHNHHMFWLELPE